MQLLILKRAALTLLLLATLHLPASATERAFVGTFVNDDQIRYFEFALGAPGSIVARTLSYNGGTNLYRRSIPVGGFPPILTLFDHDGLIVQTGTSIDCSPSPETFCWDSALNLPDALAGRYTLALSQDGNLPLGTLDQGYSMSGKPGYTAQYLGIEPNDQVRFIQVDGRQRSGNWAIDIWTSGNVTSIPEPDAWAMLCVGWLVMWLPRLRRR